MYIRFVIKQMQISKFYVPIEEKECLKDQKRKLDPKTVSNDDVKNTKKVQLKDSYKILHMLPLHPIFFYRCLPMKKQTMTVLSKGNSQTACYRFGKKFERKLHTIGCSCHQNELSIRAIFFYGSIRSPITFIGPLIKLCGSAYQDLPQVELPLSLALRIIYTLLQKQ